MLCFLSFGQCIHLSECSIHLFILSFRNSHALHAVINRHASCLVVHVNLSLELLTSFSKCKTAFSALGSVPQQSSCDIKDEQLLTRSRSSQDICSKRIRSNGWPSSATTYNSCWSWRRWLLPPPYVECGVWDALGMQYPSSCEQKKQTHTLK